MILLCLFFNFINDDIENKEKIYLVVVVIEININVCYNFFWLLL